MCGEPILTAFLLWRVLFVSTLFFAGIIGIFEWTEAHGASIAEARPWAVNTLVVMEVFYQRSPVRNRLNIWLPVSLDHGPSLTPSLGGGVNISRYSVGFSRAKRT